MVAFMKKKVCESCNQETEILAKFCNWCGNVITGQELGQPHRIE